MRRERWGTPDHPPKALRLLEITHVLKSYMWRVNGG
jgi:hypothetical protein